MAERKPSKVPKNNIWASFSTLFKCWAIKSLHRQREMRLTFLALFQCLTWAKSFYKPSKVPINWTLSFKGLLSHQTFSQIHQWWILVNTEYIYSVYIYKHTFMKEFMLHTKHTRTHTHTQSLFIYVCVGWHWVHDDYQLIA